MRIFLLFLPIYFFFTVPLTAQVAVIANSSCKMDSIDKNQLLDFYTGDIKKWQDNSKVIVLDLKPRLEIRDQFYDFIGKSSSRMKSIWLKKMLSGEGDPPQAMNSELEILKKVSETPGAIGYVSKDLVNNKVKVLAVIE